MTDHQKHQRPSRPNFGSELDTNSATNRDPFSGVPSIDQIVEGILITNRVSAHDPQALMGSKIDAILALDGSHLGSQAETYGVKEIVNMRLEDGENAQSLFEDAVEALKKLTEQHARVLVHCHAGQSRSPSVVAGYLVKYKGLSPEEALAAVKAKRSCCISHHLEESVKAIN